MTIGRSLPASSDSSYTFRVGTLIIAVDHELRLLAVAIVQSEGCVKSHGVRTEYRYLPAELTIVRAGDKVCPCCTRTHKGRHPNELCQKCIDKLGRLSARDQKRQRSRPSRPTAAQT